ncbi:cilia- and flagella-associated protein 61-like [Onthophagus taurus]|uniref:cilia- and flagella-associated protein 61-like n=1 Tax=Onthophagus taurus TaxID=166361 RepID=UPI0039BE8533
MMYSSGVTISSWDCATGEFRKNVLPKLHTRPLVPKDKEKVESMVTEITKRFFGPVDVLTLLHLSYMSIGLENNEDELVAAMILNNYPNIASVPPWDWMSWIYNLYGIDYMHSTNTLWVHFTDYVFEFQKYFLDPLLSGVFNRYPNLQFINFIAPPLIKFTEWLLIKSTEMKPNNDPEQLSTWPQRLFVFTREKFTDYYRMRAAVVEDNDDLVRLLQTHSKRLKDIYGDFYIAEMLKIDPTRNIIVAECEQDTVAVMCLNSIVNIELLNEEFELEAFNALQKPSSIDKFRSLMPQGDIEKKESSLILVSDRNSKKTNVDGESDSTSFTYDLNTAVATMSLTDLQTPSSSDDDIVSEGGGLFGPNGITYIGMADLNFSSSQLEYNHDIQAVWTRFRKLRGSELPSQVSQNDDSDEDFTSSYGGDSNCFTLELAAAHPKHELSLRMLLKASFELYPNKDYCVMSVPSTAPPFDLQTGIFVRVPPRPKSTFSSELYVVHRNALYGRIRVREAFHGDIPSVERLLQTCYTGDEVLDCFLKVLKNVPDGLQRAFVVFSDTSIIGVAVIKDLYGVEYMKSHYNISQYTDLSKHKPGCLGELEFLCMSPIFVKHTRIVLVELHRLTDYSFFCYKTVEPRPGHKVAYPTALNYLLPVIPIKIPQYNIEKQSDCLWKLDESLTRIELPYACYICTPVYCGIERIEVNDKVVIVGGSSIALSFLVEMIFQQESKSLVTFNNMTLVSTHGLDHCKDNSLRDVMLPLTGEIDSKYLSLISLQTYVNVITGVMEGIDRKKKCITVNASDVPYSILILTCGKQYSMPRREKLERDIYEHPNNVFIINTGEDVDIAVNKLTRYVARGGKGSIIVYGHTIESYCTIQGLLKMGILPEDIVLVLPAEKTRANEFDSTFNDLDIERTIIDQVKYIGVTVYEDYSFETWKFDSKHYNVTAISFQSMYRSTQIPCLAAFLYVKKDVSTRTFKAIHKAGLVYDGALVIKPDFTTNDSNIYAAGTFTKYPRRYYADHMLHAYYNQTEIGQKLAKTILTRLLSSRVELRARSEDIFDKCQNPKQLLVPRFKNAVKITATLPGNLTYFHIRKPGLIEPHAVSLLRDDYGTIITTGDLQNLNRRGYFQLHLNKSDFVETITCLSKFNVQTVNLSYVWGKHEQLLNNLKLRYKNGEIKDLYKFFAAPAMMAIYCSHFEELEKEIMDILMSFALHNGESVIEDVISMLNQNNWKSLTEKHHQNMLDKFFGSNYEKVVEEKVMEFLKENKTILPMYGDANMYNMVIGESDTSPLFRQL